MSSSLHRDIDATIAELRNQQARIRAISKTLMAAQTTTHSKDKTVEATVNAQGFLLDLKFRGERYRDLAPAELGAKVVEVVRAAQNQSAATAAAAFSDFVPSGAPTGLADADFDFDAMFDDAIERASQPQFPGESLKTPAEEAGNLER